MDKDKKGKKKTSSLDDIDGDDDYMGISVSRPRPYGPHLPPGVAMPVAVAGDLAGIYSLFSALLINGGCNSKKK